MITISTDAGRVAVLDLEISDLAGLQDLDIPLAANRKHRKVMLADMAAESDQENRFWRGGVRTLEDGAAIVMGGWEEGLQRAMALTEGFTDDDLPQPKSRRRQRTWGSEGDELHEDRILRHEYDMAFQTTRRAVKTGAVVITVAASWGGNGGLSGDQLFWTGAAMVALSDILEDARYATSLQLIDTVTWGGRYNPDRLATVVRVKEPGEPLRAETVAAISAHPGVYRSLAFAATQLVPWDCTSGLGVATELDDLLPVLIANHAIDRPQVVIPKLKSHGAAAQFLRRAIADIERANYVALGAEDPNLEVSPC